MSQEASDAPVSARRWPVVAVVLLAPALALLLTPIRISTGGLDPMTYLGYLNGYDALAVRFPQTYHGNRIAYLLVDRTAMSLLGFEAGYFAVRGVLLALAAAAMARIGWRLGGPALAVLGATLVTLVPWLSRQLLWTHYDGFAATYLLLAAALLVGRRRPSPWAELGAGVLLGLAVNTNLVMFGMCGALGLAWIIARRHDPLRAVLPSVGRVVLGVALALLATSLVLSTWYPDGPFFSETVAFRFALELGSEAEFYVPMQRWIGRVPVLWFLPLLVVLLAVALRWWPAASAMTLAPGAGGAPSPDDAGADRRWMVEFALIWLAVMVAVMLFANFVWLRPWPRLPYYRVHLLPATLTAVLALVAVARERGGARVDRAALVGAAAIAALWVVGVTLVDAARIATVVVMLGLALGVALLRRPGPAPVLVGLLAPLLLVSAWGTRGLGEWEGPRSSARATAEREWDIVGIGLEMQDLIESEVPLDRNVRFWHAMEGDDVSVHLGLAAMYYGLGENNLHRRKSDEYSGMPDLEDGNVLELVESARPMTAVLLGASREDVGEGYAELVGAGLPAAVRRSDLLEGEGLAVHVLLVDID
ncbi:MAG: hypothetical protein RLZZ272_508 [Actinomycetota bacterium]